MRVGIRGLGLIGRAVGARLVAAGHEVTNISRGASRPYLPHAAWGQVLRDVTERVEMTNAECFAGIAEND